ncbi:MAG: acetyl-CoA carboxylase biotin carboxylase subunit [Thermoanaerobaculales bacterium]|jgi:acetyl-CoA carboxylase biotin carboxylase subunit|nr:acetyl-CoA carboxylase biotin carboxylase subunit [Thermoanaerobaculales bacterium]
MLKKVLIANRGEIAVRIIAACRDLGIATVAVHSEADRESLHVELADESVCIGPAASSGSYLNVTAVISAAEISGADAIHPGYGFLAENARFAEIAKECGLVFIGPSADAIRLMGNKAAARSAVADAGCPVLPGSDGALDSSEHAVELAEGIGYPVILKASAGGGGRGMRLAWNRDELKSAYDTAWNEAEIAFGDPTLYLEKFVQNPRHIEFQILADSQGRVVHLGERECSIQRRHQKILEEAPSAAIDDELRSEMGKAAVAVARAAKYVNAGTIEFLLADDGSFSFMEMNTRIQVEHPVTELVTGVDLVREQLLIAGGEPISIPKRRQVRPKGHAIEFRINAEDPESLAPSPGRITHLALPGGPGVRVDTHLYSGYTVPPHYDSLIAKLLVYGCDRSEAIIRGRRALSLFRLEGIKTSIPLHLKILDDPDFQSGDFSTAFMERYMS